MADQAPSTLLTEVIRTPVPPSDDTGRTFAYGTTPPEAKPTAPTSSEEKAHVLYGNPAIAHKAAAKVLENAAFESLATTQQARAEVAKWLPVFDKYAIGDSQGFAEAIASVNRAPPTAETRKEWDDNNREWMRSTFGNEAGNAMQRVAALIKADPKLREAPTAHPTVFKAIVNAAEERRRAGKR